MLGKSVVERVRTRNTWACTKARIGRPKRSRSTSRQSDCVVLLGAFMTDINLGIYTAESRHPRNCIYATSEQIRIRHHHYHDVKLEDFLQAARHGIKPQCAQRKLPKRPTRNRSRTSSSRRRPITVTRLMSAARRSNSTTKRAVIADVGDSLFAATELIVRHNRTEFLAPCLLHERWGLPCRPR
jgi:indolepyruvate decarboxylase